MRSFTIEASLTIGAVAVLAGLGCERIEAVIPEQSSAVRQYQHAVVWRKNHEIDLADVSDMDRLLKVREVVRQTFAKVCELFPEDREVTPLARLEVIGMRAGLDTTHVQASKRDFKLAAEEFHQLQIDYPEYEYIQVKARFDEARCLQAIGAFERANEIYKYIWANYQKTDNAVIRQIAASSYMLSQQVRIK
jgi:hypothetical protein